MNKSFHRFVNELEMPGFGGGRKVGLSWVGHHHHHHLHQPPARRGMQETYSVIVLYLEITQEGEGEGEGEM